MQVRLLLLVTMFMLVIIAADKARDPKYYAWMWQLQGPEASDEVPAEEGEVDTILPPQAEPEEDALANEIVPANRSGYRRPPGAMEAPRTSSSFRRLEWDAWGETQNGLSAADYQQLLRGMVAARTWSTGAPPPLDENMDAEPSPFPPSTERPESPDSSWRSDWDGLVARLDAQWQEYLSRTREFVAREATSDPLTGAPLAPETIEQQRAERRAWSGLLERLETRWQDIMRPALSSLPSGPPISAAHRQVLDELQKVWDELAMQKVVDDTMGLRKAESDAWFRLLEILDHADQNVLQRESEETVGYLQLFDQPADYRGKLVTIRGTARQGYRVDAPANAYGIDEYHIFWVKPAGGPNSPFVVYALETPEGMPSLKHRDRDDGGTELNHDVTVTGYFFKRYGYLAQDQPRTCPLLLAKRPVVEIEAVATSDAPEFSVWRIGSVLALAALFAVAVAALAFVSHRGKPAAKKFMSDAGKPKPPADAQIKSGLEQLSSEPPRDPS